MTENNRRNRTGSNNPYRTISASERRARRRARGEMPAAFASAERRRAETNLPQDVINELLHNPTKIVTEDQLRSEYGYVLTDIRGMFILAAGLIVLLFALATVLPR